MEETEKKDQGLGTKGTAALEAGKAELLRKALHYVNRPATPMTRRHADPPSRHSTHLPSELGPFSPLPPHHHHCKIHQHRSRPARLQRPAHITIQASSGEIYRSSTGKPQGTERENRLGIPRLRGWEGLQYPSLTLRSDFRIQVTSWTSKNQFIQVGFKIRFHTSRIPVSSLG